MDLLAGLKPLERAKMLLSDVKPIMQALCLLERLRSFGPWIEHTQGHTHTLSGLDLDEIEAFRSACHVATTKSPSECSGISSVLKGMMAEDPLLKGKTIDDIWPIFQIVCGRLHKELGHADLCGGFDLARLISFFLPLHVKHALPYYKGKSNGDWLQYIYDFNIEFVDGILNRLFFREADGRTCSENLSTTIARLGAELIAYVTYVDREMVVGDDKECWKNVFWRDKAPGAVKFPTLVKLAHAVLCLTISNAPLESAFSSLRIVDNELTQRATTETLFAKFSLYFNKKNA